MNERSVAIIGKGVICAIGETPDIVFESLRNGKSGIARFRHLDSCHEELPVGEVADSDAELKHRLGVPAEQEISRTSLLGAIALRQALEDSGLDRETLKGKRVMLISGTTVGGMDVTERHFGKEETDHSYILAHDCGSNTAEIAELAELECDTLTISTACSSALNSIALGARMLLRGEADIVFAGGAEALTRFHLNGFNSLMILDTERCRPFDATRRGLNLGEGAAFVALCRTDETDKKGQAYIAGFGNRCDAFHQTATSPDGEGAFLAMREALGMARISPDRIGYVNAHGTGTPDNDKSESAALKRIFGEFMPPVSSTKSCTGHTTSASGAIETVISVLALEHGLIPANIGWSNKDEECIMPVARQRNIDIDHSDIDYVLCNSFGFGGNDSSLIISRHPSDIAISDRTYDAECKAIVKITEEELVSGVKKYVPAMEARRLSKLMKAATLTSLQALEDAGDCKPDAIVIGTRFGMLEQGEKILEHLASNGEEGVSPTLFMQSTHNTIAGSLAIRLGCHGYNLTISNGESTRDDVMAEARRLISEGKAKCVLAGVHDLLPDQFCRLYEKVGSLPEHKLYSEAMVMVCK